MDIDGDGPDAIALAISSGSSLHKLRRRVGRRASQSVRGFLRDLGPGLTTGAADDDPSGISTYSIAGASFGFATLWTTLFSVPLMIGVQLTCARIGLVTHRGLAAVLRDRYSPWLAWSACMVLVVANTVNIAADFNSIRLLLWAAVLNGLFAPPLLVPLFVVSNDRRTMGAHHNGWVLNSLTGLAEVVMTAAALAFLLA